MENNTKRTLEDFDIFDPRYYDKIIDQFYSVWDNVKIDAEGFRQNFLAIIKTLYGKRDSTLTLYNIDMSVKELLGEDHFGFANMTRTLDIIAGDITMPKTYPPKLNGQAIHYLDQIFLKT